MTDREMLEFAAKAGGINLDLTLRPDGKPLGCSERGLAIDEAPGWWNPLTDDGDALRLAVKLNIGVQSHAGRGDYSLANEGNTSVAELHNGDPLAATRLAITRCAAEIGRNMK